MRHAASLIFTVLSMYFFGKDSFRGISLILHRLFNIKLSHVSVAQWCVKFAPVFNSLNLSFLPLMDFNSDEWHADETVVKIRGKKHYLWFVLDAETRFVLGFYLADRSASAAHATMQQVMPLGRPKSIVTDNWSAYRVAVKKCFPCANHICVENFSDNISNNVIESFNKTFKAWYKTKCGFDSYSNAHALISTFVFFYNFLRPHGSLNKLTPAQVAGLKYCPNPKNIFVRTAYIVRH
jgi:transposase-like protein